MPDLYLFTVADVLKIPKLAGHVLLPGIPATDEMPDIVVGAPLVIVTPAQTRVETVLASYALIRMQPKPEPLSLPITVPYPLTHAHIPPGSRVYLVDPQEGEVLDR
ncbi:hypothetical protein [Stenotrophomonas sp. PD6]|uniref:hypothetical protein n=1 Tax=Stenotrophomonas sp. PD6 TaxID=3368612 RepID=UPI003BA37F15